MKNYSCFGFLAVLAVTLSATTSRASIQAVALGSGAPPASLGTFTMTPFGDDTRGVIADEVSVPSPLGGSVGFSIPLSHREIGNGWSTWSHGYTGDVYCTNGATGCDAHFARSDRSLLSLRRAESVFISHDHRY